MMRTIFMGNPDFAVPSLEVLAKRTDVGLVITGKDKVRGRGKKTSPTPVKERALDLNLPIYETENINTPEGIMEIEKIAPDLIIVVAFGQRIKPNILNLPKYGCVNVHGSVLPKLRGAAPIQQSILDGEEETGITIMRMEEGLDSGPILLIKKTEIGKKDAGELFDELAILGGEALGEFLTLLEKGEVVAIEQNHEEATFVGKIHPEMGRIDFTQETAEEIERKIRAFSPRPGAYFHIDGVKHKVFASTIVGKNLRPGEYQIQNKELIIGCQKGSLSITSIQKEGKKRMAIGPFLAGASLPDNGKIEE